MLRKTALVSLLVIVLSAPALANSPVKDSDFTGKPSPQFDLVDIEGNKIVSSGFFKARKATLINFWGLRCGACLQEMPHLNELFSRYRDEVNIVGVNVDGIDGKMLSDQIRKMGLDIQYAVAPDPDFKMAESFKMTAAPLTFVIDSGGVVRYRYEGYEPGDERKVEEAVKSVLGAYGGSAR